MKGIVTGVGSFESLIRGGYLYVDKTKYLYELVTRPSMYYFLSRPRRFGKSLTLSTLEAIFKGKRELFKGLYLDSTDYDWKEYPVIHMDFSDIHFDAVEGLKCQIKNSLLEIAAQYKITIPSNYEYNEVLIVLISQLAEKEGVVVLIDEYNFADYIHAGVQKKKTTREKYLEDVKTWYDGYCFAPETESVYNPVSVGSFFSEGGKIFTNYWISTGGMPYILTEVAKRVHFDISFDTKLEVPSSVLKGVDLIQMVKTEVNKDNFLALLYQSGYLTIKSAELIGGSYLITLDYPNKEVKEGLNEILLPLYLGTKAGAFKGQRVLKLFYNGNVDAAMTSLSTIYASIPYNELVFNAENVWHASFLSMLTLMGAEIVAEEPTNVGRIDAVITCPKYIYIIEFKFNQSAEVAIAQIRSKKYWEKYLNKGKEIHLLGINFSTEQKNIVQWKDEIL